MIKMRARAFPLFSAVFRCVCSETILIYDNELGRLGSRVVYNTMID